MRQIGITRESVIVQVICTKNQKPTESEGLESNLLSRRLAQHLLKVQGAPNGKPPQFWRMMLDGGLRRDRDGPHLRAGKNISTQTATTARM